MTTADDILWLTNEATWLRAIDTAMTSPSATAIYTTLSGALPGLTANWTAAHPSDSAGPDAIIAALKSVQAAYAAIYVGGSSRLQDDANRFDAIASRANAKIVTPDDITWLTSEADYLTNIDSVVSDASTGLMAAATNAILTMYHIAQQAGNAAGMIAISDAAAAMNSIYKTIYSNGPSVTPATDAFKLRLQIIPDMQKLIALTPLPAPNVRPPAPIDTTTPKPSGMSTGTFLVGAAAVVGVGWFAWYMMHKQRPMPQVQQKRKKVRQ